MRASSSSQYSSRISCSSVVMSERMMFSTRMRADSSLPCCRQSQTDGPVGSVGEVDVRHTSSSWAMARRCCFAMALSFCCTMRRRLMESLSWTLILAWLGSWSARMAGHGGVMAGYWRAPGLTVTVAGGAIVGV